MGFIERAFTPPGTGGREAQAMIAAHDAAQAAEAASKQVATVPEAPKAPQLQQAGEPPKAPPQFMSGGSPGAKAIGKATPSFLGAAAGAGDLAKASAGGGQRKTTLG